MHVPRRGGDYDTWDLEVRGGMLGVVRAHMTVEEHGQGRQCLRFRARPRWSLMALLLTMLFVVLATGAALDHRWMVAGILHVLAIVVAMRAAWECANAMSAIVRALGVVGPGDPARGR